MNEQYQDDLFKYLVEFQKKQGHYGLFGKPDSEVFQIMTRLYNANLKIKTANTQYFSGMVGILHAKDNVYVTMSEGGSLDGTIPDDFLDNMSKLKILLELSNIHVSYLERETNFKNQMENNASIIHKPELKPIIRHELKTLFDEKISVTLVSSEDYMANLSNHSYPPFIRSCKDGKCKCVNGSTCVESKLFSLMHQKFDESFDQIVDGFVAMWISDKIPNELHKDKTHQKYTYVSCAGGTRSGEGCDKFEKMVSELENLDFVKNFFKPANEKDFRIICETISVACPGCLLNYDNYKYNRMFPNYEKRCAINTPLIEAPLTPPTTPSSSFGGRGGGRVLVKYKKTKRKRIIKRSCNKRLKLKSKKKKPSNGRTNRHSKRASKRRTNRHSKKASNWRY